MNEEKKIVTTDLQLDEPGSLPRPGPLGRLARLGFGGVCVWYVYGLILVTGNLIDDSGGIRNVVWNGLLIGLFLVSYIVNIGFSRAWKKWPAFTSAGIFALLAAAGYVMAGTIESNFLARSIWVWEVYLFSHLGLAFLIAGVIGTPGCEMRAFHDLYSRLTGVPTKEHYCPVGPLHPIEQWEAARSRR